MSIFITEDLINETGLLVFNEANRLQGMSFIKEIFKVLNLFTIYRRIKTDNERLIFDNCNWCNWCNRHRSIL